MNKYAFLCGINKYQNGNNLRGCVNDVMDIRERLIKKYRFDPDNIRVLTDERATKKAIVEHIEWLIGCCSPADDDCLVYYHSGHGTKFRIRRGSNLDNYETACLCPTDHDWDDPLSADILHGYFNQIPQKTSLTFITDCCNSGNLYRKLMVSELPPPKPKSMVPPPDIAARSSDRSLAVKQIEDYLSVIPSVNVLFLSGCQPTETSADAYIDGRFNGALTAALKAVIDRGPAELWESAYNDIGHFLEDNGFDQHPSIKGSTHTLTSRIFEGQE